MDTAQGASSSGELTARRAEGTVEAEQPTQTPAEAEGKPSITSLNDVLRQELGAEVEEQPKKAKAEEKPEEKPEEEEQEPEQEQEPEEKEEQEEEAEVPGDWPKTAKARVAEEARKRRERTTERDQWKAEAEKLAAQLQQAATPQLRPTKALSEVVDRQSLAAAENHWKEIRRFARTNPDGAYDVLVGQNPDGTERREDFPKEKIIQMGLDADEAIEALPARREFVAQTEAQIAQAKAVYPDLWKATEAGREAAGIVQRAPWILQEPDWAFVVGDYLAGRKMRMAKHGKNGGGKALSPGAQALLGAPKVAAAPGVIKSRSASGGPGGGREGSGGANVGDLKQAREEFASKDFAPEAMDDFITKLRLAQGAKSGAVKRALA